MNKRIKSFLLIFMSALTVCFASSCFNFDSQNATEMREDITNDFITNLNERDSLGISAMFSVAKISEDENFDSDLESLINYFDGKIVDVRYEGGVSETLDSDGGSNYKIRDFLARFYTADTEYRVTMHYCYSYKNNNQTQQNMLGIWSLYVIKSIDFTGKETSAYWGDSQRTPGINIGVNRA